MHFLILEMKFMVTLPHPVIMMNKRYTDESWDYRSADTKPLSHGFHTYPAMMIPQIAKRLIETYGKGAQVLLDPFMGSGTSLVEAKVHSQFTKAYGIDINPLARLIGKVKTTPMDIQILEKTASHLIEDIQQDMTAVDAGQRVIEPVYFKNVEYWFKPLVARDLTIIKKHINNSISCNDARIQQELINFFSVAFSEVVRSVSNTRNSEFKLFRMPERALERHNPNTFLEFKKRIKYNIAHLAELNQAAGSCVIQILNEDTRTQTSIPAKSVDLVVSSPPYGDSKTTVAYGQFSRLSLEFLGYDECFIRKNP